MKTHSYSLSSNAYKNNVFAGFSQLQKQEEFVDLTLAADGHMVKVHRNLIALASPYLREILKSMSHHSPVIFLNNVTHDILTYLLNYIYLGEVNIPVHSVDAFIEVSKSLCIAGIEDLEAPKIKPPQKLSAANIWIRPPEKRANISDHTSCNVTNKDHQQYGIENNVTYMDNQKQTDIINNAKFVIQQDESYNEHNQSSNVLQNVSLVHINDENNVLDTQINHNIHTDIPDQNQTSVETIQNLPIIEITNTDQHIQANTNYKIVFTTKDDHSNSEAINNMPGLEIQPIIATQDPKFIPQRHIQYDITTQAIDKSTPKYAIQSCNLTDINIQEHQIHDAITKDLYQTIQTGTGQSMNDKNKPVIKVLDKIVIKPGVRMLEAGDGSSQISLDASVSSDCKMDLMKHMAQFSITERGALHMILNRYIYCCHHTTRNKRRWRCIEYRRNACKAFVDTVNEAIVARSGLHAHPFHDKKIYKKHNKGLIFPTLELAKNQRDLKEKDGLKTLSIEDDDDNIFMDIQNL